MSCDTCAELAVRAARAEIERDKALERARSAEEAWQAWASQDKEKILDTLRIIGYPARDIVDIYRLNSDWRKAGGNDVLLEKIREIERLRQRVEDLEFSRELDEDVA